MSQNKTAQLGTGTKGRAAMKSKTKDHGNLEEIGDSLFNLCKADKMLGGERF
jgi:hypothetical protein